MKLPPYGKTLAERLKYMNLPLFIPVCTGMNSWDRAKQWNAGPSDTPAIWLPPNKPASDYKWPVAHCHVIIDWDTGPSAEQVLELVRELLLASAALVNTRPLFTDYKKPLFLYQNPDWKTKGPFGGEWMQAQETMQTYQGAQPC